MVSNIRCPRCNSISTVIKAGLIWTRGARRQRYLCSGEKGCGRYFIPKDSTNKAKSGTGKKSRKGGNN